MSDVLQWLSRATDPEMDRDRNEMCRREVIDRAARLEREVRRLNNAMRHLRASMKGSSK